MLIEACKKIYEFNCRFGVNVLVIVSIKNRRLEREREREMVCEKERERDRDLMYYRNESIPAGPRGHCYGATVRSPPVAKAATKPETNQQNQESKPNQTRNAHTETYCIVFVAQVAHWLWVGPRGLGKREKFENKLTQNAQHNLNRKMNKKGTKNKKKRTSTKCEKEIIFRYTN